MPYRVGDAGYTSLITSSILNYKYVSIPVLLKNVGVNLSPLSRYENGRRYHAFHEGEYILVNRLFDNVIFSLFIFNG